MKKIRLAHRENVNEDIVNAISDVAVVLLDIPTFTARVPDAGIGLKFINTKNLRQMGRTANRNDVQNSDNYFIGDHSHGSDCVYGLQR